MGDLNIQTVISIVVASISFIAVIVSIYYNHKTNKRYLKSQEPLLSFKLLEFKNEIFLKVSNTGKSAAKGISIKILKLENNGDRNELSLDSLFENKFELYPEETTQGRIAFLGESICTHPFPKIHIDVQYEKSITRKKVHIERTVIFTTSYDNKIYGDFNIDLRELNKSVDILARANLRTANYLDGCQVAPFDELNILAHKSLHDDLKSVKEGENSSTVMERTEVIKNRA